MLIGIGGTGQHVALAYLHLAQISNFNPGKIYIIDVDNSSHIGKKGSINYKLKNFQLLFDAIDEYRKYLEPLPKDINGTPKGPLFKDILPVDIGNNVKEITKIFCEYKIEHHKIDDGFYALPQMGSIAAKRWLQQYEKEIATNSISDKTLEKFHQDVKDNSIGKIALIASNFGGTGAGTIATIANQIRNWRSDGNLNLFAMIQRRWFNLPAGGGGDFGFEDTLRNEHSALYFYQDQLKKTIDQIYLMKLIHKTSIDQEMVSENEQFENKHFIHLLTAIELKRVMNTYDEEKNHQIFEYDWELNPDGATVKQLNFNHFKNLKKSIDISFHISITLDFLSVYLKGNYKELAIEDLFPRIFKERLSHLNKENLAEEFKETARRINSSLDWFSKVQTDSYFDSNYKVYDSLSLAPESFSSSSTAPEIIKIFRSDMHMARRDIFVPFFLSGGSYIKDIFKTSLVKVPANFGAKEIYNVLWEEYEKKLKF